MRILQSVVGIKRDDDRSDLHIVGNARELRLQFPAQARRLHLENKG